MKDHRDLLNSARGQGQNQGNRKQVQLPGDLLGDEEFDLFDPTVAAQLQQQQRHRPQQQPQPASPKGHAGVIPGFPKGHGGVAPDRQLMPYSAPSGAHHFDGRVAFQIVAGVVIAILMFWGWSTAISQAESAYNAVAYGYPRSYHTQAIVDTSGVPSQFVVWNVKGKIYIVEFIDGDLVSTPRVYAGPDLSFEAQPDQAPAVVTFQDVNYDGKLDMILLVHGQRVVFLNQGQGLFKAQTQAV